MKLVSDLAVLNVFIVSSPFSSYLVDTISINAPLIFEIRLSLVALFYQAEMTTEPDVTKSTVPKYIKS